MDPITVNYNAVSILDVDDPAAASLIRVDSDPVAVAAAGGRAFVARTSASYDAARTGRLGNDVAVVDIATEAVTPVAIPTADAAIIDVTRAAHTTRAGSWNPPVSR